MADTHIENFFKQLELLKANANEKINGLKNVESYINSELNKLSTLVDLLPKNNNCSFDTLSKAVNLFVEIMSLLERIDDLERNISGENCDTLERSLE